MKILIVSDYYSEGYGGPYFAISTNTNSFYEKNIDFKLIYQKTSNFNYKLDVREIVKNFDIIHIYGLWRPFLAKVFYFSKKENKKIIISPLGALEPWSLSQKKIKKKIGLFLYQRKILNECDYIHTTSQIEKKNVINIGIKNKKIIVIPHGVHIPKKEKKLILKKTLKRAIFFSRIHEKKGLLELVNSWSKKNLNDWCLDIYGPVTDTKYLKKIKKRIKILKLENDIKIFEPVYSIEKKQNIYSYADCFILPSKSENFGISIAEALSYSLPVLTTTATPWQEIQKKNAGIIFNMSQANLDLSLKKFLSKPNDELYQMGLNGKKLIKDKFDQSVIIEEYVNLYKNLIK